MNNVDLKTLSITEKKSLAYDLLALIEQTQRNLQIVNQAIAQDQQPKEETKETIVKE